MVNAVRRRWAVLTCLLAVTGCGAPAPAADPPSAPPATSSAAPAATTTTTTAKTTKSATTPARPPAAKTHADPPPVSGVVVLDPGHNGGNAAHPEEINRQVPAGRGQTKPCNTTGTATNAGFPEHEFTWRVAVLVRHLLEARGVKVLLTRPNDTGVGPCVDARAAVGNDAKAAAVVSIHADGSTDPSAHGFHVAYSSPPLNAAQGQPSLRLARTLRNTLRGNGFPTSSYIGSAGLSPRSDLGGLNLSTRPAVLVECGNMRNAAEAAAFTSASGQRSYAKAIAAGIVAYLS